VELSDCYQDVNDALSQDQERLAKLAKQLAAGFSLIGQERHEALRWRLASPDTDILRPPSFSKGAEDGDD
jgi:hypothetical protein